MEIKTSYPSYPTSDEEISEKVNWIFLTISIIIGIISGLMLIYALYIRSTNNIIAINQIKNGLITVINIFSIIFGWLAGTINRLFFYFPPLIVTIALIFWLYGIFISSRLLLNEKEVPGNVIMFTRIGRTLLWLLINLFVFYRFILLIYNFYNIGLTSIIIREQMLPILTLLIIGLSWLLFKSSKKGILRHLVGYPGLLVYTLILIILYETIWLNELLVIIYPSDQLDFLAGCIVIFGGYNIPFYLIRIFNYVKIKQGVR